MGDTPEIRTRDYVAEMFELARSNKECLESVCSRLNTHETNQGEIIKRLDDMVSKVDIMYNERKWWRETYGMAIRRVVEWSVVGVVGGAVVAGWFWVKGNVK